MEETLAEYRFKEALKMLSALVELHEGNKVEIPFSAYARAEGREVHIAPDNRRQCYVLTTQ